MHWYLIHTKPRQEQCALSNLERQGYECYLPMLWFEKQRHGAVSIADEPLFPRYLFVRLGCGHSAKGWGPIRSTRGVNRMVSFGSQPARVDSHLIDLLKSQEMAMQGAPVPLFKAGERVRLTDGAFAGIEGIYQMVDGEHRALVLIQFLNKPVAIRILPAALRKVG